MKSFFRYDTTIGEIYIASDDDKIVILTFGNTSEFKDYNYLETDTIKNAYCQISEYLQGKRKDFSVPIELSGTDFQMKVWNELLKIPYGAIVTYKDIAVGINNPKAVRAVGRAIGSNPIAIIVPCHRVIGSNGKLVGYAWGLDVKSRLLDIERKE